MKNKISYIICGLILLGLVVNSIIKNDFTNSIYVMTIDEEFR